MIEVVAIIDAGVHPVHGQIVKGQHYFIEESQFADQLFERVETSHDKAPAKTGAKKGR